MHRLSIISLAFIACTSSEAAKPDAAPPQNRVCARLATVGSKAECKPERSTDDIDTAMVNEGKGWAACGLAAAQLQVVCAAPFAAAAASEPAQQPAAAAPAPQAAPSKPTKR